MLYKELETYPATNWLHVLDKLLTKSETPHPFHSSLLSLCTDCFYLGGKE
jgi:hypothetical protein